MVGKLALGLQRGDPQTRNSQLNASKSTITVVWGPLHPHAIFSIHLAFGHDRFIGGFRDRDRFLD